MVERSQEYFLREVKQVNPTLQNVKDYGCDKMIKNWVAHCFHRLLRGTLSKRLAQTQFFLLIHTVTVAEVVFKFHLATVNPIVSRNSELIEGSRLRARVPNHCTTQWIDVNVFSAHNLFRF